MPHRWRARSGLIRAVHVQGDDGAGPDIRHDRIDDRLRVRLVRVAGSRPVDRLPAQRGDECDVALAGTFDRSTGEPEVVRALTSDLLDDLFTLADCGDLSSSRNTGNV